MGIKRNLILLSMMGATASPALAQNWDWSGGRRGQPAIRLVGAGVPALYPELRASNRGRAFVLRNFDRNRDGRIQPIEAREANRAFEILADGRRDRFDWEARDRGAVVVVREGPGRWDRGAMRGYGFRQTQRGATMTLAEEVLFATDSAVLRPGAIAKLEPLADYLRATPGVRVAIDGHTDSRGTDAHNNALSLRRADAVRAAFDQMGVTRARFSTQGFGERQPVATNATAEGMRRNRRVEITLLGRRATEFDGR